MSFSGTVKEELSKRFSTARHCKIAEIAAILNMSGRIEKTDEGCEILRIQTENEAVARKCFTLLRKTFNIDTSIFIHESNGPKRGKGFTIDISEEAKVREILMATKLEVDEGDKEGLRVNNMLITQKSCCKRAFIRGMFLCAGSISDPEKGYHFEIVCPQERKAQQLQEMISSFHIDAKIILRKKSYVVYIKDGSQIVDMLAVMEANVALMNLENIRIIKEMRNSVNRKFNCEMANINKTANAAVRQISDIQLIGEKMGFHALDEGLAQVAELRLQYPEATLKELGMMLSPQVGKSGVNHRLKRLSILAEKLRENKEELL